MILELTIEEMELLKRCVNSHYHYLMSQIKTPAQADKYRDEIDEMTRLRDLVNAGNLN